MAYADEKQLALGNIFVSAMSEALSLFQISDRRSSIADFQTSYFDSLVDFRSQNDSSTSASSVASAIYNLG